MDTQDLIDYYASLLIIQYIGKPKAFAHIQTLATPFIMDQVPLAVQNAFNLTGNNTAVGKQLDVIGKYVGVSRSGFGFSGPITLNDSDFLLLIALGIIRNSSSSSLAAIQALLIQYFPEEIYVFDYQNMRMSYMISSSIGSQNLVQLFISEGLLPKPMGVQLATTIYAPDVTKFLSFRTYDANTFLGTNPNTYDDYETNRPWLTYDYGYGVNA